MSTQKMRELAAWVKEEYGGPIEELAGAALAEVEAIEKAAEVAHRLGLYPDPSGLGQEYVARMRERHEAVFLFSDIASDVRERRHAPPNALTEA